VIGLPLRVAVYSLSIFLQPFSQFLQGKASTTFTHTAPPLSLVVIAVGGAVVVVVIAALIRVSLTTHQENGLCAIYRSR
jgi:hypothetical protein